MSAQNVQCLRDLKILACSETKGFQWPTLVFALFVMSMTLLSSWLAATGVIPLWLGMIVNAFFMTQGYTAAHECAHHNLHGRHHHLRWLNDVVGVAAFSFTLHSYTVHSLVHRLHHAHTNDPERDTDAWVSEAPNFPFAVVRSFLFYFYTNYFVGRIYKFAPKKKTFVIRAVLETVIPIGAAIFLANIGYWRETLMLWVLPALGAFAGVSFFVDWLPHHVDDKTDVMKSTIIRVPSKTWRGWLMKWAYNFHNYHLIHHLVPSVPWYAQERTFAKAEPFLNYAGAQVRYPDARAARPAPVLAE